MNGNYFFYKLKLKIKQILKSHQMLMGSWKKIITKTNYGSKDSHRNSQNIYENTPKYIYRQLAA